MNPSDDGPARSAHSSVAEMYESVVRMFETLMRYPDTTELERRSLKSVTDFVRAEIPGLKIDDVWYRSLGEHDRP